MALRLGVALSVLGAASSAQADPVRTVLIAPGDQTAGQFLRDLSTWWSFRDIPSSDRLVVQAVRGEHRRLHEVDRGRGDFALVSMAGIGRYQQEYPALAVIAVLWPNYLHVLTRNPVPSELAWPLQWPLRIAYGAEYVQDTLHALLRQEAEQAAAAARPVVPGGADGAQGGAQAPEPPLPDWMLPPDAMALAGLDESIVLLSAPLPAPQVLAAAAVAQEGPPLRLLPLSAELLEEFKLTQPWLVVGGLRPEHYPFLRQGLEVPVVYSVVVARRDLSLDSARKMLLGLYEYTSQAVLVNPLFAQVDKANLKMFNGIVPLHPATRVEYGLREPAGTANGVETVRPLPAVSPAAASRRAAPAAISPAWSRPRPWPWACPWPRRSRPVARRVWRSSRTLPRS